VSIFYVAVFNRPARFSFLYFWHVLLPAVHLSSVISEGGSGDYWEAGWKWSTLVRFHCWLLKGACRKDGERLFTRVCSGRTRGNGCKLKEGRFRLYIRKKFFLMRVVRQWQRLPREAVAAPSLAGFKARLDGALSTLGWWEMCSRQGGWNQVIFKVPSNPNHSMIL